MYKNIKRSLCVFMSALTLGQIGGYGGAKAPENIKPSSNLSFGQKVEAFFKTTIPNHPGETAGVCGGVGLLTAIAIALGIKKPWRHKQEQVDEADGPSSRGSVPRHESQSSDSDGANPPTVTPSATPAGDNDSSEDLSDGDTDDEIDPADVELLMAVGVHVVGEEGDDAAPTEENGTGRLPGSPTTTTTTTTNVSSMPVAPSVYMPPVVSVSSPRDSSLSVSPQPSAAASTEVGSASQKKIKVRDEFQQIELSPNAQELVKRFCKCRTTNKYDAAKIIKLVKFLANIETPNHKSETIEANAMRCEQDALGVLNRGDVLDDERLIQFAGLSSSFWLEISGANKLTDWKSFKESVLRNLEIVKDDSNPNRKIVKLKTEHYPQGCGSPEIIDRTVAEEPSGSDPADAPWCFPNYHAAWEDEINWNGGVEVASSEYVEPGPPSHEAPPAPVSSSPEDIELNDGLRITLSEGVNRKIRDFCNGIRLSRAANSAARQPYDFDKTAEFIMFLAQIENKHFDSKNVSSLIESNATRCEQALGHKRSRPYVSCSPRLDAVSSVVLQFGNLVEDCHFTTDSRNHDWQVFKKYLLRNFIVVDDTASAYPNHKIVKLKSEYFQARK